MKEKVQEHGESEFVLLQNGEEKRLKIGEEVSLDSGSLPDHEQIVSFVIIPKSNCLKMKFNYAVSFFTPSWGNLETRMGSKETEFSTTFSNSVLAHEHDRISIHGTEMYFNPDLSRLTGKDWVVEYKPLLSL